MPKAVSNEISEIKWESEGSNVEYSIEDGYLYIRVPVGEEAQSNAAPSASGKTNVLGTTKGFTKIGGGISFGLNVVHKAAK